MDTYIEQRRAPEKKTLWHGSKLTPENIKKMKESEDPRFRMPKVMSLTDDLKVAQKFAREGCPLLKFYVQEGCNSAAPVHDISMFPDEREWMLRPYTTVQFREREKQVF